MMNDPFAKSSRKIKQEKNEKKSLDQALAMPKDKEMMLQQRMNTLRFLEQQPGTSSRADNPIETNYNKKLHKNKNGKLRKFLSLADNETTDSFQSAASSTSWFSPTELSEFRSADSVNGPRISRDNGTQRTNFAQSLIQNISALLPMIQEQKWPTTTPIAKTSTTSKDVSAQISLTLPVKKHVEVELPDVSMESIIEDSAGVQNTASKAIAKDNDNETKIVEDKDKRVQIAVDKDKETEIAVDKDIKAPSAPEGKDEIVRSKVMPNKIKNEPEIKESEISAGVINAKAEPAGLYENDMGGYTSEVDDIADDSMQKRKRKATKQRGKELNERKESNEKDLTKDQRKLSQQRQGGGSGDTNLTMGTAFVLMVIPPNGGYAWCIMVMSFFSQIIVDGIIFSVGIILPYMAHEFGTSHIGIAMVASVQIGCYFLTGPISSAFINRFGFRKVALMGVFTALLTLTIATFSTNLTMLIIFYSILGGPALSMIWVSSQLIIGYYFERYRPIANGISCSGAGAGVMIFCYLNSQIIGSIGWRNTCRVHIGILCLIIFIAISFAEVEPTKIATTRSESETDSEEVTEQVTASSRYLRPDNTQRSFYSMKNAFGENIIEMASDTEFKRGKMERCLICCCPAFERYVERKKGSAMGPKRFIIRADPIERQDIYYTGPARYEPRDDDSTIDLAGADVKILEHSPDMVRSVKYNMSMMQLTKTARAHKMRRRHKKSVIIDFMCFLSPTNWLPLKVKRALRILFDFHLLQMMEFKVLCLSAALFATGFNIPFVYSRERAQLADYIEDLIAPSIGLSNFIGRILCGFAAYKYRTYTNGICGFGILFGGSAVFISGFYGADSVWFQFIYAFCYGIAPAFYSTLRSIIYVRYLGLENLTNAFGISVLGMGFGVFLGTTVAGFLYDMTGSTQPGFIFSGTCLMLSGALKLILPTLSAWKKKKTENNLKKSGKA